MWLQASQSAANRHDDRGAATLRDALIRNEKFLGKEKLLRGIDSWISAIKAEWEPTKEAVAIHSWYWGQVRTRSYQAPSWKITPEKSALFQKFRSDPYYHLKNLVEIVARTLVEEMLKDAWMDAKVMVTSDSDDVFAGVDFIVETRTASGSKDYVWFDLAVSDNPEYLEKKGQRTRTVCREFNQYMGWKKSPEWQERTMVREVFALPPKVMAGFLPEFMKRVAAWRPPSSKETMEILDAAKIRTVATTKDKTQSRVASVLLH